MTTARQEIEDMTRQLLRDRLAQCTDDQNERFGRYFPKGIDGVDVEDLPGVIDLINRTITKNATAHSAREEK